MHTLLVFFFRLVSRLGVKAELVQAKSIVALVNRLSIPRFELLFDTIGARLSLEVIENINKNIPVRYWSDLTLALTWKQGNENWKPFVWIRVQKIRRITKVSYWQTVPGEMYAVDLQSSGCSPRTLVKERWWEGPRSRWLRQSDEEWAQQDYVCDKDTVRVGKEESVCQALLNQNEDKNVSEMETRNLSVVTKLGRRVKPPDRNIPI